MRLNREQYHVFCVARRGLTISRLRSLREFTNFVVRPNIVFVQIGGNDMYRSSPIIPKLAEDMKTFCRMRRIY